MQRLYNAFGDTTGPPKSRLKASSLAEKSVFKSMGIITRIKARVSVSWSRIVFAERGRRDPGWMVAGKSRNDTTSAFGIHIWELKAKSLSLSLFYIHHGFSRCRCSSVNDQPWISLDHSPPILRKHNGSPLPSP